MSVWQKTQSKSQFVMASIILCGIIALVCSLAFSVQHAWADGSIPISALQKSKTVAVPYSPNKNKDLKIRAYYSEKPITKATSSKKNVATVRVESGTNTIIDSKGNLKEQPYYMLVITLKKAGTTKITFTTNAKKYSVNYKIEKYANPFKSFKIGKKNYTTSFNPKKVNGVSKVIATTLPIKSCLSGKVTMKLKKNWKVTNVWASVTGGAYKKTSKAPKLKDVTLLMVDLKNTKTKATYSYYISPKLPQI